VCLCVRSGWHQDDGRELPRLLAHRASKGVVLQAHVEHDHRMTASRSGGHVDQQVRQMLQGRAAPSFGVLLVQARELLRSAHLCSAAFGQTRHELVGHELVGFV
jgi:hypothetical protein